jgi:cell division protease FtsH
MLLDMRGIRMNKKTQLNMLYVGIAVLVILLLQTWLAQPRVKVIPYSEFEQLLKANEIKEVSIRQNYLEGKLQQALPDGGERFLTTRVDPQLADRLSQAGVKFTGVIESTWLSTLLSWVLPVLVFFAIWKFFFRRIAEKQGLGGMMSIGKSKAKVYVEKDIQVTRTERNRRVSQKSHRLWPPGRTYTKRRHAGRPAGHG